MAAPTPGGSSEPMQDAWIAGDIWISAADKPATFKSVPRREITVEKIVLEFYAETPPAKPSALTVVGFSLIKPGSPEPALALDNEALDWDADRRIYRLQQDLTAADPRLILDEPFMMEATLSERPAGNGSALPGELRAILMFGIGN